MISRRDVIAVVASAAAWPLIARGQPFREVRRVALLLGFAENDARGRASIAAFAEGLRDRGWLDGDNLSIEIRWMAGEFARYPKAAHELLAVAPDLILVQGPAALLAVRGETSSLPIVFVGVTDPLGQAFVASLAKPGGNITGFTNVEFPVGGKWLQTLKEIAPGVTRVLVLSSLNTPKERSSPAKLLQAMATVSGALGVQTVAGRIRDLEELDEIVTDFAGDTGGGLIVLPDNFLNAHRPHLIDLAQRLRLPALYPQRNWCENGGLICYGANPVDLFRRSATYVDRILRGENPADLPVQNPTRYELIINRRAAKALGLPVPASLLARADLVLE